MDGWRDGEMDFTVLLTNYSGLFILLLLPEYSLWLLFHLPPWEILFYSVLSVYMMLRNKKIDDHSNSFPSITHGLLASGWQFTRNIFLKFWTHQYKAPSNITWPFLLLNVIYIYIHIYIVLGKSSFVMFKNLRQTSHEEHTKTICIL